MAKPVKGDKQDNLNLIGTDGADKMQGKDGNDTFFGGEGNDQIDGGNGIDTAIFSGSYADYSVVFKGTGNNKITVTGADGTDELKHIEFLKFDDAVVNVTNGAAWEYQVNAAVDPVAQDSGNLIVGSGIPATGFGLARNEDAGIELGLQVIYRQGP